MAACDCHPVPDLVKTMNHLEAALAAAPDTHDDEPPVSRDSS
jgi:hypothetical protein